MKKLKAYLVPLAIGVAIAALVFFLTTAGGRGLAHRLCDAFFISGVLVTGCGGLTFTANHGIFNIFGYGIYCVLNIHWPWLEHDKKEKETYADYCERKRSGSKSPVGQLLAGTTLLALSAVFLAVYYLV